MTDKEKIIRALQKLEFNIRSTAQYTKTDDSYLAVMCIANAIGDTVDEIRKDFPEN